MKKILKLKLYLLVLAFVLVVFNVKGQSPFPYKLHYEALLRIDSILLVQKKIALEDGEIDIYKEIKSIESYRWAIEAQIEKNAENLEYSMKNSLLVDAKLLESDALKIKIKELENQLMTLEDIRNRVSGMKNFNKNLQIKKEDTRFGILNHDNTYLVRPTFDTIFTAFHYEGNDVYIGIIENKQCPIVINKKENKIIGFNPLHTYSKISIDSIITWSPLSEVRQTVIIAEDNGIISVFNEQMYDLTAKYSLKKIADRKTRSTSREQLIHSLLAKVGNNCIVSIYGKHGTLLEETHISDFLPRLKYGEFGDLKDFQIVSNTIDKIDLRIVQSNNEESLDIPNSIENLPLTHNKRKVVALAPIIYDNENCSRKDAINVYDHVINVIQSTERFSIIEHLDDTNKIVSEIAFQSENSLQIDRILKRGKQFGADYLITLHLNYVDIDEVFMGEELFLYKAKLALTIRALRIETGQEIASKVVSPSGFVNLSNLSDSLDMPLKNAISGISILPNSIIAKTKHDAMAISILKTEPYIQQFIEQVFPMEWSIGLIEEVRKGSSKYKEFYIEGDKVNELRPNDKLSVIATQFREIGGRIIPNDMPIGKLEVIRVSETIVACKVLENEESIINAYRDNKENVKVVYLKK